MFVYVPLVLMSLTVLVRMNAGDVSLCVGPSGDHETSEQASCWWPIISIHSTTNRMRTKRQHEIPTTHVGRPISCNTSHEHRPATHPIRIPLSFCFHSIRMVVDTPIPMNLGECAPFWQRRWWEEPLLDIKQSQTGLPGGASYII